MTAKLAPPAALNGPRGLFIILYLAKQTSLGPFPLQFNARSLAAQKWSSAGLSFAGLSWVWLG